MYDGETKMKLILGLVFMAAIISMVAPYYAYGQSQIAALPPAVGPDTTTTKTTTSAAASTMPIAQCIDFNSDGICEYVVLANGTMVTNPLLYGQQVQPVNPMTQLVERQRILIQQQSDNDDNSNDRKRNDPCNYYGLNVCDSSGNCDNDRFDCLSDDCVNGQPGTTGQCDGDDDKICWVNGEYTGKCEPNQKQPVAAELPPCDGSYQDCVTPRGDVCEAGSGAHECEIEEPEEEAELSCQEEDDFCEPGCESPSMDCIDDVNIGDDGEDSVPDEEEESEAEEEAAEDEEPADNDDDSFEEEAAADEEAGADEE
jgi:hypothetical protein